MKSFIILLILIVSLQSRAFCWFSGPLNQDINSEITENAVCEDVESSLFEKFGSEINFTSLSLIVTYELTGQVGINFQAFTANGEYIDGSGHEVWYPGYSFFQIY